MCLQLQYFSSLEEFYTSSTLLPHMRKRAGVYVIGLCVCVCVCAGRNSDDSNVSPSFSALPT